MRQKRVTRELTEEREHWRWDKREIRANRFNIDLDRIGREDRQALKC